MPLRTFDVLQDSQSPLGDEDLVAFQHDAEEDKQHGEEHAGVGVERHGVAVAHELIEDRRAIGVERVVDGGWH